jgi:hypothetical protein
MFGLLLRVTPYCHNNECHTIDSERIIGTRVFVVNLPGTSGAFENQLYQNLWPSEQYNRCPKCGAASESPTEIMNDQNLESTLIKADWFIYDHGPNGELIVERKSTT